MVAHYINKNVQISYRSPPPSRLHQPRLRPGRLPHTPLPPHRLPGTILRSPLPRLRTLSANLHLHQPPQFPQRHRRRSSLRHPQHNRYLQRRSQLHQWQHHRILQSCHQHHPKSQHRRLSRPKPSRRRTHHPNRHQHLDLQIRIQNQHPTVQLQWSRTHHLELQQPTRRPIRRQQRTNLRIHRQRRTLQFLMLMRRQQGTKSTKLLHS